MNRFFSFILIMALISNACNTEKKCPYKPQPIFEKGLPHIQVYNFEREGQYSLESLLTDRQVLVEIEQDVCEKTRQEYRFTVKGDYASYPDSLWPKEAVRQLTYLSTFSEKQAPLREWAGILEAGRKEMKIGQEIEVQPGISAKIDRIISPQESKLILVFSQK